MNDEFITPFGAWSLVLIQPAMRVARACGRWARGCVSKKLDRVRFFATLSRTRKDAAARRVFFVASVLTSLMCAVLPQMPEGAGFGAVWRWRGQRFGLS